MKTKKMFLSVVMITTVMLFAGGCGNVDLNSMTPEEIADYADDYGIDVTIESTEDVITIVDETEVEDEEIVEETDVGEDEVIVEDDTGTEEAEAVEIETPKTDTGGSGRGSMTVESTTTETKTDTGGSTTNESTTESTTQNAQVVESTPAPATPAPHTHNWLEHTATKQVWVPNIVIVDDYEDRVTGHVDDVFNCDCGYSTGSSADIESHIVDNVLAGNAGHGGFGIKSGYDIIERVIVGSHEEDHGHNETQIYVDYYYCECGETQ